MILLFPAPAIWGIGQNTLSLIVHVVLLGVFVLCFIRTRHHAFFVLMIWSVAEMACCGGLIYEIYYFWPPEGRIIDGKFVAYPDYEAFMDSPIYFVMRYRWLTSNVLLFVGMVWLCMSYFRECRGIERLQVESGSD